MPITTSSSPSGRKPNQPCSTLSLIFEKMFSKYLMKPAPRTGPIRVPAPPRMVISTTSPEAVHCIRSAPASGSIDGQQAAGETGIHARDHEGRQRVGARC